VISRHEVGRQAVRAVCNEFVETLPAVLRVWLKWGVFSVFIKIF